MKQEDLKKVFNKPPQSFHNNVICTVNSIDEKQNKHTGFKAVKTVLICAIIIVIGITGAVAGSAIYTMLVTPVDKHGLNIELEPINDNSIDYVKLKLNYIPQNVEEIPNTAGRKYSQKGNYDKLAFSFILYKVDQRINFTDKYITSYEEFQINGNKALITNASLIDPENNVSKHFYIFFEDKSMFLSCYVSDDFTNNEIKKVMEGITIEKGSANDCFEYSLLSDLNDENNSTDNTANSTNSYSYSYNYDTIYSIGQPIDTYEFSGSITINQIEVLDNINGLDENNFYIPGIDNLSAITDENGNITPYERYTYSYGDGTNSLNKIEKTENINRKLVYLTVTVTNNTAKNQIFNIYDITLNWLKENGGKLDNAYSIDETLPQTTLSTEINYIDNNMTDSLGIKSGYYQLEINANSSETVHLGYFVDDDTLDELYITIYADGENYSCVKVR